MSGDETKLVDASADYSYVVRDGEPVGEPRWRSSRVVLTGERLVLAGADGDRSIPHGAVELVADRDAVVPDGLAADGATALRAGDSVLLVDAADVDAFDREYCRAALDAEVILVRHPAVVGGVVRDTEWSKARFRLADDAVKLAFPGGETASVRVADVDAVETTTETVMDESRTVVRLEHADAEGRGVETHFSGTAGQARALERLLESAVDRRRGNDDRELTETESQVLVALYSGVSPFEMADFVGLSVEEVEEVYAELLKLGAVDEVRERTEVSLNGRGRNLASEAMSEQ